MDDDIAESYGCMTADWLNEQLADFMYTFENDSDGEFVAKANFLSKQYHKKGEDFVSELIAFATNQKQTHVNFSMLDSFEQLVAIINELINVTFNNKILHKAIQNVKDESFNVSHTKIAFSAHNRNSWLDESSIAENMAIDFSDENFTLPEKYLSFTPIKKSVSDVAYQNRKDSGKIIGKFTGENFTAKRNDATKGNNVCKVVVEKIYTDDYKNLFQYGAEKDLEQVEALVSRVRSLCDIIKEENETLADDEETDLSSLKRTTYSGFIVNNTEDPLDVSNCSLQCIDQDATVINLDLSNLKAYSLFPGKIVAFCGTFVGEIFVPNEIFEPKEPSIASFNKQSDIDLLHVWCACGPFSSSKTLSYEQLYDLIELVRKERPDILILIGPFIDRTSPVVKSSQCCYTYNDFMDMLLAKIDDALSGTDVQVLIVPNGKKDAALRPSFPTPPFHSLKQRKQQLSKNIILLPDPATIRIAGIEFAITASEIIQHLGRDEIGRLDNFEDQDRMSRLVRNLFRQRSLYPLYPAAQDITYRLREAIERTPLTVIPHIIILPSILAPTVKVVADSIFVNTNALVRGSGGTYMKMKIDLKGLDAKKDNLHTSIADFCEVQLIRL
uniref:DNA polymerase alpha subunit B n=1 Tax=Onchocerca volvulus TaxID=6282 RepID=A0A8R1Y156_ONCVO